MLFANFGYAARKRKEKKLCELLNYIRITNHINIYNIALLNIQYINFFPLARIVCPLQEPEKKSMLGIVPSGTLVGMRPGMISSRETRVESGRRWAARARVGQESKEMVRIQPGIGIRDEESATKYMQKHTVTVNL